MNEYKWQKHYHFQNPSADNDGVIREAGGWDERNLPCQGEQKENEISAGSY